MATRHQLQSLRHHPDLERFCIPNVQVLYKELGVGAYGSVVELEINGTVCAGKKMHNTLIQGQTLVSKYVEECKLMSDVRHPNLVQFLGLCFLPDSPLPVIVMERLLTSFDDLLETNPTIPLCLKRSILADVAKGLRYLHSRKPVVIHRDLSARNVLLDTSMHAKISDLGNARITDFRSAQRMSSIPGAAVYMPPEAISENCQYGPRLDSFSFGHLALFAVTQVFPGEILPPTYPDPENCRRVLGRTEIERREKYIQLLHQQLDEQHPLTQLVKHCLDNEPSERPSAEEILQQLESMRGQTVSAYEHLTKLEMMKMLENKDAKAQQQAHISELEEQSEHLRSDNDGLSRQLQSIVEESEMAQKGTDYDILMQRFTELQQIRATLEKELGPLREEREAIFRENSQMRSDIKRKQAERDQARKQTEDVQARLQLLEIDNQSQQKLTQELQVARETSEQQIIHLRNDVSMWEKEARTSGSKLQEYETRMRRYCEERDQARVSTRALEVQIGYSPQRHDVRTERGVTKMFIQKPTVPPNYKSKPRVIVKRDEGSYETGRLMFGGSLGGKEMAGVQLDLQRLQSLSSYDGTYKDGRRYFTCPPGYALYLPLSKVYVEAASMKCPLCLTPVANSDDLQLHYLTSCSGYAEAEESKFEHGGGESSASASAGATADTSTVQFMWLPLTEMTYPKITLLASFECGSVELSLDPKGSYYASDYVTIKKGTYEGQLVIGDSFVNPVKNFTIEKDDDAVILQFEVSCDAFHAQREGQLNLTPGEYIKVRKQAASGWWEGELQSRGKQRQAGWFPANRVEVLTSRSGSGSGGSNIIRARSPLLEIKSKPNSQSLVLALYSCVATWTDELNFHKGSVITVLSKEQGDWWRGELNGQVGLFPSNYVQPLTEQQQPLETTRWADSVSSQVLAAVSDKERKRQEAIFELLSSERNYIDSLKLVKEVFFDPIAEEQVLTQEELSKVRVNWDELLKCNTNLLNTFLLRLRTSGAVVRNIGDVLSKQIPDLTPHIRWCSCQLTACTLLQSKSSDANFREFEQRCTQDPRTGGLPLSSFLLKPIQRITRYPLLIKRILDYTPEGDQENEELKAALEQAEKLCTQVNEAVRSKENTEQLEWLQTHIQFTLDEDLVFNSQTNFMGSRKLLHWGKLFKIQGAKDLVGFLFNDFFLLIRPKHHFARAAPRAELEPFTKNEFQMYKQPWLLDGVRVKKAPQEQYGPSAFLFLHPSVEKDVPLRAENDTARDQWTKKIMQACMEYIQTKHKMEREQKQKWMRTLKDSIGVLKVKIVEAADLLASNANGKSDPFCVVKLGDMQEQKTEVIPTTLNPRWNCMMDFAVRDVNTDVLEISVFDKDLFSPNDFLGCTKLAIKDLLRDGDSPWNKRLPLEDVANGEIELIIELELKKSWLLL